jgi:steroid delta-isomerase-like uncharacterized protein
VSTDQHKALLRRLYDEVFTQGNIDVLDEIVAEHAVEHKGLPGIEATGREGVWQLASAFRRAFPDLTFEVHDLIAEGDKVVGHVTIHGTHEGELVGIPPTGRRVSVAAIDIVRAEGGKLAEHWGVTDNLAMLQQLGIIPALGESGA